MNHRSPLHLLLVAGSLALSALGCQSGGVGDPCIPEDEYQQTFNGYGLTEVNIESKSFQCETRVCLVNHFEGRVSCPYGQAEADLTDDSGGSPVPPATSGGLPPSDPKRCRIPGTDGKHCVANNQYVPGSDSGVCPAGATNADQIKVTVASQLLARNSQDTVYCSCRCKGPDPEARYCECPSGYECSELVRELGLPGKSQLAGSYCIKAGTLYDPIDQGEISSESCAYARDHGLTKSSDGRYDVAQVCGPNYANP
ncbi:MAG TPA: hypothetical protein VGQ57_13450 [Polyangiaceae bacterium]|jgi:hypothetical protein|nr:hypothetical protein [Polyangiaceae bacterium]